MLTSPGAAATLCPPTAPPHYVRRGRLLDLLDEAVAAPLTLVVAPAGAGKTSLLAGWAAEHPHPVAWLSLDECDRDPVHHGRRVATALDAAAPVLVIDNVQVIDEDDRVAESLTAFLQHLPRDIHVVAASRRDLALPLDRLRARGQLREVRFSELRFTPDEARDLLSQLAPSLGDDQLDLAVAQADGWAASLQLVALAARSARASNEDFAPGDDGALVRDYILHEVLAAEEPGLVEALADVAVVDRVSPGLARALTGRSDAGGLLRRAEARGLCVSRLSAAGWFEIHPLMRAALAARAPDRLSERHARAARWYEEAGETVPALEHWLRAGHPRAALRLLSVSHAELCDDGQDTAVVRTIAAIPADVASSDLQAMLDYAWCHLEVDRHRFRELVETLTWWADRPGTDAALRPRVTLLQSFCATTAGRWIDAGTLARQALTTMGLAWWRDPLGRFGWNQVAREVALSESWDETADDVRQADMALSRDAERRLAFEGTRALGEALAGRPVDALRVAATVRSAAAVRNMAGLRFEVSLAEAVAHRELGERARALGELEALAGTPPGPMLSGLVLAAAELVQAHLDEGDLVAAQAALARAETLVEAESVGAEGRSVLARAGALVALAGGAVTEARTWCARIEDDFWAPVSAARVSLAEGNRAEAEAALDRAVPRCSRHEVVRALRRARAAGDRDRALRLVAEAVERAASLGLLQTVACEGAEVVVLAERAGYRAPEQWMDRLRRAAIPTGRAVVVAEDPVATLTGRERDVLRLLAGRLTVREIAAELYVSPNTLKFHLKTIYRKLGVGSRAEAADVARRMTAVQPR